MGCADDNFLFRILGLVQEPGEMTGSAPLKDRVLDWVYYAVEYFMIRFVGQDGPRGLIRWILRIPVWLHQIGLGSLAAHNLLVITTRGRKTGRVHLNAMRYEHDRATDTFYVLSGWGGRTDWYRNVRHDQQVFVAVGRRRFPCTATLLPAEDTIAVLHTYLNRNPFGVGTIRIETGITYDGEDEIPLSIASYYPAVAFRPSG